MNLKSSIESVLFIQGEPITVQRIAKIVEEAKGKVLKELEELKKEYAERGIILIKNGEEWQLATNPQNKEVVDRLVTSDLPEELTKSALEILSIVAYKGPISRAKIEYIRGVNSSFVLRNLLIRGLVTREENPKDKRSYLYSTSNDFLKYFGLTQPADLPRYEEFQKKKLATESDLEGNPQEQQL